RCPSRDRGRDPRGYARRPRAIRFNFLSAELDREVRWKRHITRRRRAVCWSSRIAYYAHIAYFAQGGDGYERIEAIASYASRFDQGDRRQGRAHGAERARRTGFDAEGRRAICCQANTSAGAKSILQPTAPEGRVLQGGGVGPVLSAAEGGRLLDAIT